MANQRVLERYTAKGSRNNFAKRPGSLTFPTTGVGKYWMTTAVRHVRAINHCLRWQCLELVNALQHHRRITFEQASTAHGKQGFSCEYQRIVGKMDVDHVRGKTRCVQNTNATTGKFEFGTIDYGLIDTRKLKSRSALFAGIFLRLSQNLLNAAHAAAKTRLKRMNFANTAGLGAVKQ